MFKKIGSSGKDHCLSEASYRSKLKRLYTSWELC